MATEYLDKTGLIYYEGTVKERLAKKADIEDVPTKTSQLTNDSGFITAADVPDGAIPSSTTPKMDGVASVGTEKTFARGDHVHPTDTSRLATNGDGSQLTISFNPAASGGAPESGDTLSEIVGQLSKNYQDLGDLAYKDKIGEDDLPPEIVEKLDKADSALQDYTETDPTVPDWAKEPTKPTYTATEVGAIPATELDNLVKKSDIGTVYTYKGTVASKTDLPASAEVGDVYNVEETDMNYAWNGEAWDPLGGEFTIFSITNEEIDAIVNS